MGLRERISKSVKAGLGFIEVMEAGASGFDERRMESLIKRVTEVEETLRSMAVLSTAKIALPSSKLSA